MKRSTRWGPMCAVRGLCSGVRLGRSIVTERARIVVRARVGGPGIDRAGLVGSRIASWHRTSSIKHRTSVHRTSSIKHQCTEHQCIKHQASGDPEWASGVPPTHRKIKGTSRTAACRTHITYHTHHEKKRTRMKRTGWNGMEQSRAEQTVPRRAASVLEASQAPEPSRKSRMPRHRRTHARTYVHELVWADRVERDWRPCTRWKGVVRKTEAGARAAMEGSGPVHGVRACTRDDSGTRRRVRSRGRSRNRAPEGTERVRVASCRRIVLECNLKKRRRRNNKKKRLFIWWTAATLFARRCAPGWARYRRQWDTH